MSRTFPYRSRHFYIVLSATISFEWSSTSSTTTVPMFHIRPVSSELDDGLRFLHNVDHSLSWLASIGSGEQWGSQPRSTSEASRTEYRTMVKRSEAGWDKPWELGSQRAYVAEVYVAAADMTSQLEELAVQRQNGIFSVPVAGMVLQDKAVDYIHSVLPIRDENDPFVFVKYLLSDRRAGALAKGAGGVLLEHAKAETKRFGLNRICLDCWRGNDRKLVK